MSSLEIPSTQRAWILPRPGQPLRFVKDHLVPSPSTLQPNQCLIKLTHSGVCRSDLLISQGHMSPPKDDLIGGHEGIGEIVAIGSGTSTSGTRLDVGKRVGVKYVANACHDCEPCLSGWDSYCLNSKKTGSNVDGTFCEYTISSVDYVTPIPDTLTSAEAAALMCAGLAGYSAIKQSKLKGGEWVVVVGAGGGLGHYVVQYAKLKGARVAAIDSGEAKHKLMQTLGVDAFIDYKMEEDIVSAVNAKTDGEGAHVVVVAAGDPSAYKDVVHFLRPRGRLMVVGLPPQSRLDIPVSLIARKGLRIQGVFVGTRQDANEVVSLARQNQIKSYFTLRGLSELPSIYREMNEESESIAGRIVLDIGK